MTRRGLPWVFCFLATVFGAWTLSVPGEAGATSGYTKGAFWHNDAGAKSLLLGAAGTGTVASTSGAISKTGSVDNYVSRLANLMNAAANGDAAASTSSTRLLVGMQAGRFLPALTTLGTVSLAAGAFLIGWKIGRTIDDYYLKLGDPDGQLGQYLGGAGITSASWTYGAFTACSAVGGGSCWKAQAQTGSGPIDRYGAMPAPALCDPLYCNTDIISQLSGMGGTAYTWPSPSASCSSSSSYAGPCTTRVMSATTMMSHVTPLVGGAVAVGATAPSFMGTTTASPATSYTVPSDVGNATDLTNARNVMDPDAVSSPAPVPTAAWADATTGGTTDPYGGGSGGSAVTVTVPNCVGTTLSACSAALRGAGFLGVITPYILPPEQANVTLPADAVVDTLPGGGAVVDATGTVTVDVNTGASTKPFELPQPQANETYTDYVTRLRTLGWLGTVVLNVLGTAEPGTGPNGVVRLHAQLGRVPGTTVTVLTRVAWPLPLPIFSPAPSVTFDVNPPSAPPADTPGPGPGDGGDTGGSLDFTPFAALDFGCKFPYGIFCYATEATDWFNVTPEAPHFVLPLPSVTVGGHTYLSDTSYDVNLAYWSPYMAIIRDIISVVLWIGGVYYLASRLLGFSAGDPGAAVDEVHGHWG